MSSTCGTSAAVASCVVFLCGPLRHLSAAWRFPSADLTSAVVVRLATRRRRPTAVGVPAAVPNIDSRSLQTAGGDARGVKLLVLRQRGCSRRPVLRLAGRARLGCRVPPQTVIYGVAT